MKSYLKKENLNNLLDSIYELEGLVHLAINRDDAPAMLPELIRRKALELARRADVIVSPESDLPTEKKQEVKPDDPEPKPAEEPSPQEMSVGSDEEEMAEEATAEAYEDEESVTEESADDTPAEDKLPDDKPVVEEPADSKRVVERQGDDEGPRGRLVFSINDRYRFKRELFGGSDVDFNTTLSLVASMENYDEAEDYFINELQWEPGTPDVADFLEILKNYFK